MFYYPENSTQEEYNVTTIKLNSTKITQGCVCSSSFYDKLFRFNEPYLYEFYHDLNGNKIKFTSVACSDY